MLKSIIQYSRGAEGEIAPRRKNLGKYVQLRLGLKTFLCFCFFGPHIFFLDVNEEIPHRFKVKNFFYLAFTNTRSGKLIISARLDHKIW